MADTRPTFPLPQRYTQRKTEAVQPPDDRTYSAEVTAFGAQSPASSQCTRSLPYTRSIMIPPHPPIVNSFFRKNHKISYIFSVLSQNLFLWETRKNLTFSIASAILIPRKEGISIKVKTMALCGLFSALLSIVVSFVFLA